MVLTGSNIDSTQFSVVVVCRVPGCPWRYLADSRPAAWRVAAAHESAVHPGHSTARAALDNATHRGSM